MFLSLMIFIPLVGMVVVLLIPRDQEELARKVTLGITLIPLLLAVILFIQYDRSASELQFEFESVWIKAFDIHYHIGINGISVTLLLLTALLGPICVLASWRNIEKGVKAYLALFLMLETGMIGFFCAQDLFLFYVFFEVTLLPMYFLIGSGAVPVGSMLRLSFSCIRSSVVF